MASVPFTAPIAAQELGQVFISINNYLLSTGLATGAVLAISPNYWGHATPNIINWECIQTGASAALTVVLEGSNDAPDASGTPPVNGNWFIIDTMNTVQGYTARFVSAKPFRHYRTRITVNTTPAGNLTTRIFAV